ncbi:MULTISPECIES: hypothetical protein [Sphingomonas]|uniref:hypothetical protein n=1 Tax=Sphingomonas TaxID=13687 RepID=UPI00082AEC31|nr:hypothetical protein [Sphingomonas sp. CCH10-B3]
MVARIAIALLLVVESVPVARAALPETNGFMLLRGADLRLAAIGERLAIANVALCPDRQPRLGIVLHALEQYRPAVRAAARQAFGFGTPIAIEAVVPGSAADQAGIVADDGLIAIGDASLPQAFVPDSAPASTLARDAIDQRLASLPPEREVRLQLLRAGARRDVAVMPQPGCRVRFEVHDLDEAAAGDATVQIGAPYLDRFDDASLAVIVAHELSHVILRHRARLEAAGVHYGAFSELGKSGRLHRQAESEADRLSVYLLYNAGYDPAGAGRFWRGPGKAIDGGIFRNRAYPARRERAAALDAEAANIPAGAKAPFIPPLVALADQPMR